MDFSRGINEWEAHMMKMVDLVEVAYDQLLELFDECKTDGVCGSSPGSCATWCIASATAGWAAAKNRRQVARVSARSDGRGYSSAPLTGTAREARRARPRPRRLPLPCARPSRRMGRSARLGALARPPCDETIQLLRWPSGFAGRCSIGTPPSSRAFCLALYASREG